MIRRELLKMFSLGIAIPVATLIPRPKLKPKWHHIMLSWDRTGKIHDFTADVDGEVADLHIATDEKKGTVSSWIKLPNS